VRVRKRAVHGREMRGRNAFSFFFSLSLSLSLWHNRRRKAVFSARRQSTIDGRARASFSFAILSRLPLSVPFFLPRSFVKSMIFGYLSRPGRFRAECAPERRFPISAPVKLE